MEWKHRSRYLEVAKVIEVDLDQLDFYEFRRVAKLYQIYEESDCKLFSNTLKVCSRNVFQFLLRCQSTTAAHHCAKEFPWRATTVAQSGTLLQDGNFNHEVFPKNMQLDCWKAYYHSIYIYLYVIYTYLK